MMRTVEIEGRIYRFSEDRRISGRPAVIQYQHRNGQWRDVRNVDRSDQIWRIADGEEPEPLATASCEHKIKIRSCGVLVCMDCGLPMNNTARALLAKIAGEPA